MRLTSIRMNFIILAILLLCSAPCYLKGTTAVITGASRGIGLALTEQLLAEDIHVIAIVRDKNPLKTLADKYADQLQVLEIDITLPESPQNIANSIKELTIDYLVHNAAVIEPLGEQALINASQTTLRKIIETNVMAPILLTAALSTKLSSGSRILNISSRAGDYMIAGLGMYCLSKTALDKYTESFQLDHPKDILCANVHPGEVETGMQHQLRSGDEKEFPTTHYFRNNLKEGNLITAEISAQYLTWLLIKTQDDYFISRKHDIYEPSHHQNWYGKTLPSPARAK